jgi:O-antigen ligase
LTILALAIPMSILVVTALYVSMPAAAAIYAIGFMMLTWIRQDLALVLMFALVPFVYDLGIGPVSMAAADVSLFLALPILVFRRSSEARRLKPNPIQLPIALYLTICVLSTMIAGSFTQSITSMIQMIVYMIVAVFVFANCVGELPDLVSALYALLASNAFISIAAIGAGSGYVFGLNKNATGASTGYALVIAIELWLSRPKKNRQSRFLVFVICVLTGGLVSSLSRGSWAGTLAGVTLILFFHGRLKLAGRLLVIMLPLLVAFWIILPEASKDYASQVGSDSYNAKARFDSIDYAMQFFWSSPILGSGVGLRKLYDATNVIASTLAETGVLGLVAFLSIFVVFLRTAWRKRALLVSNQFAFVNIGVALTVSSLVHGCLDHYWNRGLFIVWAGVGLSINAMDHTASRLPRVSGRRIV